MANTPAIAITAIVDNRFPYCNVTEGMIDIVLRLIRTADDSDFTGTGHRTAQSIHLATTESAGLPGIRNNAESHLSGTNGKSSSRKNIPLLLPRSRQAGIIVITGTR